MTVALAIAVLVLAVGLIYLLVSRQKQPAEQPDLTPAIQEATSQVASQVVADLLRVNEESRKLDQKTAEAALEKRQAETEATLKQREAEIKSLAERIAKGQEKIEAEVRRRGETD